MKYRWMIWFRRNVAPNLFGTWSPSLALVRDYRTLLTIYRNARIRRVRAARWLGIVGDIPYALLASRCDTLSHRHL